MLPVSGIVAARRREKVCIVLERLGRREVYVDIPEEGSHVHGSVFVAVQREVNEGISLPDEWLNGVSLSAVEQHDAPAGIYGHAVGLAQLIERSHGVIVGPVDEPSSVELAEALGDGGSLVVRVPVQPLYLRVCALVLSCFCILVRNRAA